MLKRDNDSDSKILLTEGSPDSLRPGYPPLPKIISFDTLARCGDEVWIENNGQVYRLRKTKQDKLILTK
jgi:hemin uptake protein HemP